MGLETTPPHVPCATCHKIGGTGDAKIPEPFATSRPAFKPENRSVTRNQARPGWLGKGCTKAQSLAEVHTFTEICGGANDGSEVGTAVGQLT